MNREISRFYMQTSLESVLKPELKFFTKLKVLLASFTVLDFLSFKCKEEGDPTEVYMVEKKYYVEDAESPKIKNRYLIRMDVDADEEKVRPFRFDWKRKQWVDDQKMTQIFFGGIEVKPITEREAEKIIKEYYE